ncbi:hypothetical protein FXB39_01305 [Nocardioides sp. BGMRC 2183]|nr:hypothetical protein FXB39_01305 [Nocardioides sp. BGMRC 2183]
MSVRADNRLADGPMHPVGCGSCGAQVLARKSSWQQTTVQWDETATATCTDWDPGSATRGRFPVCEQMRASIAQAVVDGLLPVVDTRS